MEITKAVLPPQDRFDLMIGQLDRMLSEMVNEGRTAKMLGPRSYDPINVQTLKHHAEDMVLAGQKILKDLDIVEAKCTCESHGIGKPSYDYQCPIHGSNLDGLSK